MSKRTIFLAGAVLCLLAALWGYYLYQKPRAGVAAAKAVYTLSAASLYNEFAANEAAANEKYTGKVITVKGQVQDVQAIDSALVILLTVNNAAGGVNCSLIEYKKDKQPKKGQWVTVKGRCAGYLMDVNLVDALLLP